MAAAATAAAAAAVAVLSESSTFYGSPRSSALPSPLARCYSSSAISLPNSFRPVHRRSSILPRSPRFYVSSNAAAKVPEKKKVLIVNTNSGGHAVIGFYLARDLLASGHEVTILTVGDARSDDMKKPPFNRFSELVSAGGEIVWGDPAEVGNILGSAVFDVVLDNNGKDLDTVKPVVDWAKSSGASQFLFISSAGIYKTSDEVPHVEEDPVKEDAGHAAVEKYIAGLSFSSWAIFRPQYMIGSGNNKDCEEWFFDRIVRDRPVPIPGSGVQLTNISHVRDLSSMLVLAVENPAAASGNIFNCVCDRAVTFNGLAKLCAEAAGRPLNVVYFDPNAVGVDARKAFPFRNMHFYAEPRAAKEILGWTSTTNLPEDLKERFEEYVSIGRDKKEMKFETDDKILEYLKVSVAV